MAACVTLSECSPAERALWLDQAERVFFETAYTNSFDSAADRQTFLKRWFGNYAETYPQAFLLALDLEAGVTGYLAGCVDSFSPESKTIAGDIDYFTPPFCAALKNYPSHFHINVMPGHQGKGVGHMLVAQFEKLCAIGGSPGVHVVTGPSSRAVKFYEACGFTKVTPYAGANPSLAVLIHSTHSGSKG